MLAFVHIPKTAGTTLHKVISHQYPREKIFIHHDTQGPPSAELAARIESQGCEVIMGHFSVGLHEFIPSLRYVTCLRDPVPRLLSHYLHALHDPAHYLHRAAKSLTFAAYVSSGLPVVTTPEGGQTQYVTHEKSGYIHPASDPEALIQAVLNVTADRETKLRMGSRDQEKCRHLLQPSRTAEQLLKIYQR